MIRIDIVRIADKPIQTTIIMIKYSKIWW